MWRTRSGRKVRLCDMTSSHLRNARNCLARFRRLKTPHRRLMERMAQELERRRTPAHDDLPDLSPRLPALPCDTPQAECCACRGTLVWTCGYWQCLNCGRELKTIDDN